ncbi:hypothetical protein ABT186_15550 [Streptomyces sp. NPDC001634]|uniref:hypothetical protein n=1 Tax=Streptomyces sp. NPDC001634 TaxID=3154390 RepID=UPI0033226060
MPRRSRDKKREQKRSASSATPAAPIEVRVPAAGPGAGAASIDGVPVVAADGEEIQQAVLSYLHRVALATGHSLRATVRDERIGFVVPIRVSVDGSSELAGEPVQVAAPEAPPSAGPAAVGLGQRPAEATPPHEPERPRSDKPTYLLRAMETQKPAGGTTASTLPLRAVPESEAGPQLSPLPEEQPPTATPHGGTASTYVLRAVPEAAAQRPERPTSTSGQRGAPWPTPEPAMHAAADRRPEQSPESPDRPAVPHRPAPVQPPTPVHEPSSAQQPTPGTTAPTVPLRAVQDPNAPSTPPTSPPTGVEVRTHVLRAVPEAAADQSSASAPQPAPASPSASETCPEPDAYAPDGAHAPDGAPGRPGGTVATFVLRAVPEQSALITATSGPAQVLPGASDDSSPPAPRPHAPGTVSPPTGTFGPPPAIPARPPAPPVSPVTSPEPQTAPRTPSTPDASSPLPVTAKPPIWPTPAPSSVEAPEVVMPPITEAAPDLGPGPQAGPYSVPGWKTTPAPKAVPVAADRDDEVKEPPVREFDSVAELVLGVESGTASAVGTRGPIAEPMARINEAVKQGRIEEAAGLAEQTVAEAAATLGSDHPDVLRLHELTAYIAYLAGDPLRSFHLSLDLARIRHRLRDPRGAYGNVQSAAAAWRAVRDPMQGMHLGRDLIAVWTELAADEGPAADDLDQLEKARSRMGRLAERARASTGGEHSNAR